MKARAAVVRFAVVDDQERSLSSIWRVRSHGRHVYAAERRLAGEFKTSLHDKGRFRHAFTGDDVAARFLEPDRDRAVLKWRRPDEQVPGGTLLLQIIIPEPGLAAYLPRYELPSELIRLRRPPPNHVIYVSVVETAPDVKTEGPRFADRPTDVLSSWRTSENTVIWVVAHDAPLTQDNLKTLNQIEQLVPAAVDSAVIPEKSEERPSELRGFVILNPTDGVGRLIDLSMEFVRRARDAERPRQDAG